MSNTPINVKLHWEEGICGAFDRFFLPHPQEFDRHHLPRVGIFELSIILHPEEEACVEDWDKQLSSLLRQICVPNSGVFDHI